MKTQTAQIGRTHISPGDTRRILTPDGKYVACVGWGSRSRNPVLHFEEAPVYAVNIEFIESCGVAYYRVKTRPSSVPASAWRAILGQSWDTAQWVDLIPFSSRRQLWDFLCPYFPGEKGFGTKGVFCIPTNDVPF